MFRVSPIFWGNVSGDEMANPVSGCSAKIPAFPAMSWSNDTVASLAVGDVVPGKMKGLVLTLGRITLPKS